MSEKRILIGVIREWELGKGGVIELKKERILRMGVVSVE